jgi:hypothetical protein
MSETPIMGLPLVQAAQAQKHVTVNESLVRLDALSQICLASISETQPPLTFSDGLCHGVSIGATGSWAGQDGKVAIASNGGWVFVSPKVGWRAWVEDAAQFHAYDGTGWSPETAGSSAAGPTRFEEIEFDETISSGTVHLSTGQIPASSIVLGITARVITPVTGTMSGWKLGVSGAEDRYGTGYGLGTNSFARGITGAPVTYYADTPLQITAEGGVFSGGVVRVRVHTLQLDLPAMV